MDQEKIKEGVKLILEGVGEDVTREGLLETPDRIARMYEELFAGLTADASEHLAKTFQVDNNEMVIEKAPFSVTAGERFFWRVSALQSAVLEAALLLKEKEMLGMRLCVLHNLYFYNTMMEEIRDALDEGRYASYKKNKLDSMNAGE